MKNKKIMLRRQRIVCSLLPFWGTQRAENRSAKRKMINYPFAEFFTLRTHGFYLIVSWIDFRLISILSGRQRFLFASGLFRRHGKLGLRWQFRLFSLNRKSRRTREILHALALLRGACSILSGPMGFSLDEKHVRRAGLDYWKDLTLYMYESVEELYQKYPEEIFGIFLQGAKKNFDQAAYSEDCFWCLARKRQGFPRGFWTGMRPGRSAFQCKAGSGA